MRAFLILVLPIAVRLQSAGSKPATLQDPLRQKAQTIYDRLQAKLKKSNSLKAVLEIKMLDRVDRYNLSFLRNNFARIVSPEAGIYQDGKTYYDYNILDKEYWSRPAPKDGLPTGCAFSLGGLTGLDSLAFSNEPKMVPMSAVPKTWQGQRVTAIEMKGQADPAITAVLYLDPATSLPVGWDYELKDFKATGKFQTFTLDAPMKAADFAWSPPSGAKKIG